MKLTRKLIHCAFISACGLVLPDLQVWGSDLRALHEKSLINNKICSSQNENSKLGPIPSFDEQPAPYYLPPYIPMLHLAPDSVQPSYPPQGHYQPAPYLAPMLHLAPNSVQPSYPPQGHYQPAPYLAPMLHLAPNSVQPSYPPQGHYQPAPYYQAAPMLHLAPYSVQPSYPPQGHYQPQPYSPAAPMLQPAPYFRPLPNQMSQSEHYSPQSPVMPQTHSQPAIYRQQFIGFNELNTNETGLKVPKSYNFINSSGSKNSKTPVYDMNSANVFGESNSLTTGSTAIKLDSIFLRGIKAATKDELEILMRHFKKNDALIRFNEAINYGRGACAESDLNEALKNHNIKCWNYRKKYY